MTTVILVAVALLYYVTGIAYVVDLVASIGAPESPAGYRKATVLCSILGLIWPAVAIYRFVHRRRCPECRALHHPEQR